MINLSIRPVNIAENYAMISEFMLRLHENEFLLFDKTAQWPDIERDYMQHTINMQAECDGLCLVAFADETPAGFIFAYLEDEDESRFEVSVGKTLYISEGYVLPHYRKQGIYKKLSHEVETFYIAKGVKRITRFTLANNEPMKRLLDGDGYLVTRLLYEKWL